MSNSYNKITTDVDLELLKLTSAKQQLNNIKRNEHKIAALLEEAVQHHTIKISHAMKIVNQQWIINGMRPRTIDSYNYTFGKFIEVTGIEYIEEIDSAKIYDYLGSLTNVKDVTIQARLKQIKAILGRFHDNGWIPVKFWKHIKIKVNSDLLEASTENDVAILLSLLDKSTYSGFRDSVAIMLMYKCGIRIKTLGLLEIKHIDFENKLLRLDGSVLKSHKPQLLPLDDDLCALLQELIKQNLILSKQRKRKNTHLFLSYLAIPICKTVSPSNAIAKNLWQYNKKWGLKITCHGLRRAYAQNLIKRGADINLVSAALNHSDLTSTTKYLGLSLNKVAQELRDYL
ncbi:tyrosine-type recombinase/integrase [Caryophanon tenue]|uniref:tyrosine-type recombinase/integrase n=1 Tax=Caryophanon tenue TaxID=33978 RepID=UPI000A032940|nr:site-specific integrase [Caryophanon tenue]